MLEFLQLTYVCLRYLQFPTLHMHTHFLLENIWISDPSLDIV